MPKSAKAAKANQSKVIHPNSRKAHKITAKAIHKDRMKRLKTETSIKNTMVQEKLQWMRDNLDESKLEYSKADLSSLVEKYLTRYDGELEQISIIHGLASRKSKQHISRETAINFTLGKERSNFESCGLEVPDLCDARNLRLFKVWDGNAKYIATIKMRRIKKTSAETEKTGTKKKVADTKEAADKIEMEDEMEDKDGGSGDDP